MAHVLACALQQTGAIPKQCTLEEADVDVRRVDTDIRERSVFHAHGRTTIMHQLPNVRTALPQAGEPCARDGPEFAALCLEPLRDGGIPLDGSEEAQECRHGGGAA
jgi:hypothetical protein